MTQKSIQWVTAPSTAKTALSSPAYYRPQCNAWPSTIAHSSDTLGIAKILFKHAGIIKSLGVELRTNTDGTDRDFRFRRNGADAGSGTIGTMLANTTGLFLQSGHGDEFAVDDYGSFRLDGAAVSKTFDRLWAEYADDSGMCVQDVSNNDQSGSGTAAIYYGVFGHLQTPSATEANHGQRVSGARTASLMWCWVFTNTKGTSTVVRLRNNGADSNQSVSVPAGTTGYFYDASNVDVLTDGDRVNWRIGLSGSGAFEHLCGCTLTSRDASSWISTNRMVISATGGTRYLSVFGNATNWTISGTESAQDVIWPYRGRMSRLGVGVQTNGSTVDCTVRLRINGADGNQSVTIPASTTGYFYDSSNSDLVGPGDLVNYSISQTTSGNITANAVNMQFASVNSRPQVRTH